MGGSTTTQTQDIELTPEAQELMAKELALFSQTFLPAEMAGRGDALRGLGPGFAETAGAKGTAKTLDLARLATTKAGTQVGLRGTRSLGDVLSGMDTQRPEAMAGMQNIFQQMAMSKNSLMDPRWAQFLRPDVTTAGSTEPTAGAKAAQAASMAIAVAGLVASVVAI